MTRHLIVKTLFFGAAVAAITACTKDEPAVNHVPVIAYKAVRRFTLSSNLKQVKRDSVVMTISFNDGNGDLGEDPRDTTHLRQVFGNQSWGNYEARTFQLVGNAFEEVLKPADTKHFIDLGKLSNVPQSGTLDYSKVFFYQGAYKLVPVKFKVRLRDRDLNESNSIETDTIRVPVAQ